MLHQLPNVADLQFYKFKATLVKAFGVNPMLAQTVFNCYVSLLVLGMLMWSRGLLHSRHTDFNMLLHLPRPELQLRRLQIFSPTSLHLGVEPQHRQC